MGVTPQPGLAQLLVQRGNPKPLPTCCGGLWRTASLRPLDRAKLLPTQVEVALLLGDLDQARVGRGRAGDDRRRATRARRSGRWPTPLLLRSASPTARSSRRAEAAARHAALYDEVDLSYEAARVSLLLGQIHQAKGEPSRPASRSARALHLRGASARCPTRPERVSFSQRPSHPRRECTALDASAVG